MSKRAPFRPTSVDVTLTFNNNSETLQPLTTLASADYGGQPLFLHAYSDGDRLTLVIDDVSDGPVPPADAVGAMSVSAVPAAKSSTQVTFVFNGSVLRNWESQLAYDGKNDLRFRATVDPNMQRLHFFVDDAGPVGSRSQKDGLVSFLLFQPTPQDDFEIHWFRNDFVSVPNGDTIDGSVVNRSDPPPKVGGVTGPMGFSSP